MLNFLTGWQAKLFGGLALLLVVSVLWYRGDHYAKRATQAETRLDAAIDVANANAEAAQAYRAQVSAGEATADVRRSARTGEAAKTARTIERVKHETDNSLAGPGVRAAIGGLYESGPTDSTPGAPAGLPRTGRPVDLRAAPAAAR